MIKNKPSRVYYLIIVHNLYIYYISKYFGLYNFKNE